MALNPLTWLGPVALPRLTLLLNHIVSSEPLAMSKLQAHAGRTVEIRWTSSFVPPLVSRWSPGMTAADWAPPPLRLTITPAGLFELTQGPQVPDLAQGLTLTVHLTAPWTMLRRAVQGERPEVTIEGDSALAETASWLMKNLRWDLEDDVARWLGTGPSQMLRAVGESIRQALQRWRPVKGSSSFGQKL